MEMTTFVQLLSIQLKDSPKRAITRCPTWSNLESALSDLDEGRIRFFELMESVDERSVMTVYGEGGVYHIGIIVDETEQSWLMLRPEGKQRVEIDGNLFPEHQICYDAEFARRIVRCFLESGQKLAKADWFTDVTDD